MLFRLLIKTIIRIIVNVVSYFNISLKDQEKNKEDEFYKSLKQLVTMIFGIVFSIGLSELRIVTFWSQDFFLLALAYYVILLSWWGYHYGTIMSISEKNIICYVIDILLIIQYYLLIIKRYPIHIVINRFIIIYCAYILWEGVRLFNAQKNFEMKTRIANALLLNIIFLFILIVFKILTSDKCGVEFTIHCVIFLFIYYTACRVMMHYIYKDHFKIVGKDKLRNLKENLWPKQEESTGHLFR